MPTRRLLGWSLLAGALCCAPAAQALTLSAETRKTSLVGEEFTFRANVTDASGTVQYRWVFDDGVELDYAPGIAEVKHAFAEVGAYRMSLFAQDEGGGFDSVPILHTVHYPIDAVPPSSSASIVYDAGRSRVYSVNQDNDSIAVIDPQALTRLAELPVYRRPEALALAPNGKLWVVHRDDYAIAIVDVDKSSVERGFRLPYASQPAGITFSPTGDAAYVSLMAKGQLLKLDPTTGDTLGTLDVGPMPRGIAAASDGKTLYVTRFISATTGGEVVEVDGATFMVKRRIALAPERDTADSNQSGRGLPNYLFSVTISPGGRTAWVPGKKDNIFRGTFLEDLSLNQDNTVRPLVSVLDLAQGTEKLQKRIDLDDRSLPIHVTFSPLGEYGFVSLAGSNMVELRDVRTGEAFATLNDAGISPRATLLDPQNHLFVQNALGRNVTVYDLKALVTEGDSSTPVRIGEIATVENDKTDPKVLLGKRIFNSAADSRMAPQGYLTCAVCHFDGFEDGRVFDFTSRGEGFRNTTSLLGRRGTGHGPVHWSGNFDEIQDFEQEIRELFTGHGFMSDDALAVGTRGQALGEPKAGASADLDALAAYVESLAHVNPSPFRNQDGSMTESAVAGKLLFGKLGCDFCHSGKDFTDSARGRLHDVGTLKPSSGLRSGGPLLGIDTPTLLGIWETAPYLHDGSAATLRDVLVAQNPNDQHGFVSSLAPEQVDQLVAYLEQLDDEVPQHRLPFEPPLPEMTAGAGGGGGVAGAAGQAGQPSGGMGGGGTANMPPAPLPKTSSCSVGGSAGAGSSSVAGWLASALVAALFGRQRRRV